MAFSTVLAKNHFKISRKIYVFALIFVLFVSVTLSLSNLASATPSIQTMIDAASPGDILHVPVGTYYENLVIDKSVTLIGEDNQNTIINGGGSGNTITVSANGVTISGFTITNAGLNYPDSGIFLNYVENTQVNNNILQSNNAFGIFVMWGHNNQIQNNTILYCPTGIRVDGQDAPAAIQSNTVGMCDTGIFLYYARNVQIKKNTMQSPITVQGKSQAINIQNNTLQDTGSYALQFYASYDSTIQDNSFTEISGNPILLDGQSSFITIKNNTITNNVITNEAILLEDGSSNNDVFNNTIAENTGTDIGVVISAPYNRITSNNILCSEDAIFLDNTYYTMITGNTLQSGISGVYGEDCYNIGILNNSIQGQVGVWFETSSDISVVANNFSLCYYAVNLHSCNESSVSQNLIAGNIIGVYISGLNGKSAQNSVVGNEIDQNYYGVFLINTDSDVIRANNFTSNIAGIVFYSEASSSNVVQNNFVGNAGHVLVSTDSVSNNFDGNYWDDYVAPAPYVIDATQNILDNSPLDDPWIYLPVHNTDTDFYYSTIQAAIDDIATSDGDTIQVDNGIYTENVGVWRSVQLIGSSPVGTIVDGNHGIGFISGTDTSGIVIQSFAVTNCNEGILLQHTTHGSVTSNFAFCNDVFGIHEDQCSGNTIANNYVINNLQSGVFISTSSFPPFTSNFIEYNRAHGLVLINVFDSTIKSNTIAYNIENGLITDSDCSNLVISANWVEGNWVNGFGLAHTTNSQVINNMAVNNGQDGYSLYQCSHIEVSGNLARKNGGVGIYLPLTDASSVEANSITQSDQGLQIDGGLHNSILGNEIFDNNNIGILVQSSASYNNIAYNTLTGNHGDNLQLSNNANNNHIFNNTIQSSGAEGIRLIETSTNNVVANNTVAHSGGDGIGLETHSSNNDIISNYVSDSGWYGIHPHGGDNTADHITNLNILGNTVENNEVGIILTNAWACNVYHNNFINNRASQAATTDTSSNNVWDDGYPSGGNYWSDYTGLDQYHGSIQNIIGSDGVGDLAYTINSHNSDNYPLFNFFNPVEMKVVNFTTGGQPIIVTLTSNVTLTDVTSTPGTLSFTATGPSGNTGYIRAICPIDANNTNLKLFVDGHPISSSALTIEKNSTHYFVYAQFSLSSHVIGILFAVPEYQWAGLLSLIVCFAAFVFYRRRTNGLNIS